MMGRLTESSRVLCWYEAHRRVIASEYWEKIYIVWGRLTERRRVGAIVSITVPNLHEAVE